MRKVKNYKLIVLFFTALFCTFFNAIKVEAIYRESFSTTINLTIESSDTKCFVTYNSNGGETYPREMKNCNEAVGEYPIPTKEGYNFVGWYKEQNFTHVVIPSTIVTQKNTTYYAKWEKQESLDAVFSIPGTCTFGGVNGYITSASNDCISTINPTNSNIDYANNSNQFIDTGIPLFSEDNIGKDFEVGFTFEYYEGSQNGYNSTIFNAKLESETPSRAPGLVFRKDADKNDSLGIGQTINGNRVNKAIAINNPIQTPTNVVLRRKGNVVTFSYNDGEMIVLDSRTPRNTFAMPAWFGATTESDISTTTTTSGGQRFFNGTLSNMYIKLESEGLTKYTVTFDADAGELPFTEKEINEGNAVGELPAVSRPGFVFDGWYTSPNGGTKVTADTIINGDTTFYAVYRELFTITFETYGGTLSISPNTIEVIDGETIDELPTSTKTGAIFSGWFDAETGGTQYDGTEVITSDQTYHAQYVDEITITFDGNGGDISFSSKVVGEGLAIGELPTGNRRGYLLEGWYTTDEPPVKIDENTIINEEATFVANWVESTYPVMIGSSGYETLQEAINDVPKNGTTPTTIYLLGDINAQVVIDDGRKIDLDLNGHTISNSGNTNVIIVRKGTLNISNGTMTTTANTNGMINVEKNGTLTVGDNLSLNANGERQAIYNDAGTVYILDGVTITGSASQRAAVHNKTNGTMYIKGGTIISTKLYAVYNESGTLVIGEKDGSISTSTPVIQGKTYGIAAHDSFKFYDGIIKGQTAAVGTTNNTGNTPTVTIDTNETKISEIEDSSEKVNDQETIGNDTYQVLYLENIGD